MRESEDRYRKLFETMNEGFILAEVVTDGEGRPIDYRFLDVNPASERFFGRSREEIVGYTYKTIGGANADPEWIEVLCRVALTGEAVSIDRYAPVGGHWVHLLAYSPRARQFAAIFDDITERKRAEIALQEANEEQEVITEELRQQNDELVSAQSELRESEERYRDLVENANSIIIKMDRAGKINFFNDYAQKFFGYSLEEILGQNVMILIPPIASNGSNLEEMADSILENPDGFAENINENVRKNGERVWISWRNKAIRDARGEIIGNLTIGQDITERKQVEEALRESEERFRSAFEDSAIAMALTALDGSLLNVNSAFCQMLMLSESELIGHRFMEFTHPDDLEINRAGMDALVSGTSPTFQMEKRYIRKDGRIIWVDMSTASVRNAQGKPLYLVTHVQDITKRKDAEEALRKSDEQARQRAEELEKLMDVVPVAIWVAHDPQCNDITGNRTANEFYEAAAGENVSAGPGEDKPIPPRRFFRNGRELKAEELTMQEAAAKGVDVRNSELDVLLPSGGRMAMWGNASPLWDAEGKVRGCVGAFVDITERKRTEEALLKSRDELEQRVHERTAELSDAKENLEVINEELQVEISEHEKTEKDLLKAKEAAEAAVEAKAAFLANMSHELRTPMNAVIGFSNLLLDESLTPDQKDYIERIRVGGEALLGLINDVLDFSKMEKKKVELEHQPLSLRALVDESLDMVAVQANDKGLNLALNHQLRHTRHHHRRSWKATADPGKLAQQCCQVHRCRGSVCINLLEGQGR